MASGRHGARPATVLVEKGSGFGAVEAQLSAARITCFITRPSRLWQTKTRGRPLVGASCGTLSAPLAGHPGATGTSPCRIDPIAASRSFPAAPWKSNVSGTNGSALIIWPHQRLVGAAVTRPTSETSSWPGEAAGGLAGEAARR
jgi:hypothetical protein